MQCRWFNRMNRIVRRGLVLAACFVGLFAGAAPANAQQAVVQLAAGESFSVALLADGSVRTWGHNLSRQLGYDGGNGNLPRIVPGLGSVIAIDAGDAHGMALLANGTVKTWGANNHGQLGSGSIGGSSSTPTTVGGLGSVVAIAAGADFCMALLADGTVKAWGGDQYGQLGDGNVFNSGTPVAVRGLTSVVAIAGGYEHALALLADGTVRAWGRNQNGELGNGTTINSSTPVAVSGFGAHRVVAIASRRGNFNLALRDDGTVMAWGSNYKKQLGIGNGLFSSTAVAVPGLPQVKAICAGEEHSFALLADGTVKGWGYNVFRRLVDSAEAMIPNPVTVGGLGGTAVALAGGGGHSLALLTDGTVKAWGYNNVGQLGTAVPGGGAQSGQPLTVVVGQGASKAAPTLTHVADGLNVTADWSPVPGATGYTLLFAPYPYAGEHTIGSIDMGSQQGISVPLWSGAAFYIAVQARNPYGSSDYSNIDLFQLPTQ